RVMHGSVSRPDILATVTGLDGRQWTARLDTYAGWSGLPAASVRLVPASTSADTVHIAVGWSGRPRTPAVFPSPLDTWSTVGSGQRVPTYQEIVLAMQPVAYWPLTDPIAHSYVHDASGNGHDGTIVGDVAFNGRSAA